jgi:hypothetical protein
MTGKWTTKKILIGYILLYITGSVVGLISYLKGYNDGFDSGKIHGTLAGRHQCQMEMYETMKSELGGDE